MRSFLTPCQSGGCRCFIYYNQSQLTARHISGALLTLAGIPGGFVAGQTLALAHGNHPLAFGRAVDARGGVTDGVLHAGSLHLLEAIRHRLWEGRQALHRGRARLVVNSDRQQRHASAHVLEGQVEALPGQRPDRPRLRVDLQHPAPRDLIRGDGGHLAELPFAEVGPHVGVGLRDEEVEGFFAGHGGAVERVAVSHHKTQLHRDAGRPRAPLDEGRTQPVVLFCGVYTTNAVGIEERAVHHRLDYLPLSDRKRLDQFEAQYRTKLQ